MKIYAVLEFRGVFKINPVLRGVWIDRINAQKWVQQHCPDNGCIYVYDMDNLKINKELPGNLIANQEI